MSSFQGIDAQTLIIAQAVIAFVTAPYVSPTYNFPLFLFGIYASERTESAESLRLFSGFLTLSVIFDIIWLAKTRGQNGLIQALTIINLIVKVPTIFASLNTLRLRGDSFASSLAGNHFGSNQPVWSMPGSFSGRDGYQNVDDDLERANTPPRAPSKAPVPAPPPPQSHGAPPGGYQTL